MSAVRCRYCPQLLLTPQSRARGYGPVCGRRHGLITPTPRRALPTAPVTAATATAVHPGQTVIPIQPTLPKEN